MNAIRGTHGWRVSLIGLAVLAPACTKSDAADGPRDGAAEDGSPGSGCLPPKQIIYTTPGCGVEAIPRCEVPNGDGCAMMVCLCDGVTTSGDGCGFSHEPFLYTGFCKKDAGTTADAAIGGDVPGDSPALDAGICKGEASDLYTLGWQGPCPSLVDGGVPALFCPGPGIGVFGAECGERRTLRFAWGSHGMTCFYEQGALVGLTMWNDTPAFCASTSKTIEVGSIADCPRSAETLLIDCNPLSDGGYFPYLPG